MSRSRRLPVRFKNPITIRLRDSQPCIRDRELNLTASNFGFHGDSSSLRSELDCVIDQIRQHLKETITIYIHRSLARNFAAEVHSFCVRLHSGEFARFFRQALGGMALWV